MMTVSRSQKEYYYSIAQRNLEKLKRHIDAVRKPLDDGHNLVMLHDLYGAIKHFGDTEELRPYYQAIIDAGVRVSCIDPEDKKTYVDYAICHGRLSALVWLLKAHDIAEALKIRNPEGLLPLECAIKLGQHGAIFAITEKYREIGVSSLVAAESRKTEDRPAAAVAKPVSQVKPSKLIEFIKANDLEKSYEERAASITYYAKDYGVECEELRKAINFCLTEEYNENIQRAFTKLFKYTFWIKDVYFEGESLLHATARSGRVKLLESIFDADLSVAKKCMNEAYKGQTVGDIALASKNHEILKLITPYGPKFSTHAEKKSDTNKDRRSLLTQHVLNKKIDMLKSVLEQMPELAKQEIADSKGHGLTAVEYAFLEKNYKAAVLLFNADQPIDRALAMVDMNQLVVWSTAYAGNDANFKLKLRSASKSDYQEQCKVLLDDIVNNRLNKAEITLLTQDSERLIKERLLELLTTDYSPKEQLKILSDSLEGKNGLHTVWNTKRGLMLVSSSTGVLKKVIDKVLKLRSTMAVSQKEKPAEALSSQVVSEASAPTEEDLDVLVESVPSEVPLSGHQLDYASSGGFVGLLGAVTSSAAVAKPVQSVARDTLPKVPVGQLFGPFPVVRPLEPLKQEVLEDQVQKSVAPPRKLVML